ncbi:MAG TPA: Ser-Thr-rich GPI-anchored membrane family protein [Patescibacteria group bacterium]|nr:Ser-Thr-rich GPI-anchored membrane family protein [Patescibacteria group bacterium]
MKLKKHHHRLIAFFILLIGLFVGVYIIKSFLGSKPNGYVLPQFETGKVNFPKGGETLRKGQTYVIEWQGGPEGDIAIFLQNQAAEKEGVSVSLVDRVYGVNNTGSYNYTIPDNIPNGMYRFQIGNLNSQYFSIK